MPVAPKFPFRKVTCPSCGWSHISVQRSDVILAPSICGNCRGTQLMLSIPGVIESMRAFPTEFIQQVVMGGKRM